MPALIGTLVSFVLFACVSAKADVVASEAATSIQLSSGDSPTVSLGHSIEIESSTGVQQGTALTIAPEMAAKASPQLAELADELESVEGPLSQATPPLPVRRSARPRDPARENAETISLGPTNGVSDAPKSALVDDPTKGPDGSVSDTTRSDGSGIDALGIRYGLDKKRELRKPDGKIERRDSVSHHGITWRFDRKYAVGQFIGGDWWVVGPIEIVSVEPDWDGQLHGSMIDPGYGTHHGYDARFYFKEELRAAFPRKVEPTSSVVSVECWAGDDPNAPKVIPKAILQIPRPALRRAAVLTVLDGVPAKDAFRPPYAGKIKPIFTRRDLHPEVLPRLKLIPSTPSIKSLSKEFEHVWLDHMHMWPTQYFSPSENMPNYGREIGNKFNDSVLLLCLDFPDAAKEGLIDRLVQIGIDYYGVWLTNASFGVATGGLGGGRKWPILFAGLLLDEPALKNVGKDFPSSASQEDCQTFYLTEAESAQYPGVALGTPVWGEIHCGHPGWYKDPGHTNYQWCCTANSWAGAVLGARILGAQELWGHDALFDYQDWYMEKMKGKDWQRAASKFSGAMWDRYRKTLGPVWSEDSPKGDKSKGDKSQRAETEADSK
jgi:hypothetical protein